MTAYDIYTIGTAEYKRAFWDKAMRGDQAPREIMQSGNSLHDTLVLPADSNKKFREALHRRASSVSSPPASARRSRRGSIWTSVCEDLAEWVPEKRQGQHHGRHGRPCTAALPLQ